MANLITALILLSLTASGIVGGIFFAFSTTIMPAFDARPENESMELMKEINTVIVRTLFIALFVGNAAASVVLIVFGLLSLEVPGTLYYIIGAAVYLFGSFLVTIVFNVPRNNALAAAVSGDEPIAAKAVWAVYRREWTFWNSVRTLASILSTILLAAALVQR